tara:strand:- start:1695 stop:2435 length:741 start_codon:yes stop_codon:yes gene_type:complete
MNVTNDPKDVFTDGKTEPLWFYDLTRINFVKTSKNVNDSKQFPYRSLVLGKDGFVKRVRKDRFGKVAVPYALYLNTVRDGVKCCHKCVREFPISHFVDGHKVRTEELTALCSGCREITTSSMYKTGTAKAKRRAYVFRRRLEIIKECGCQWHEGCDLYQHVVKWSDEYIIKTFEFNHIDDTTKLHHVSKPSWFTNSRAKKHGFKTGKDFWEAEVAKCEVLCTGHHGMHTKHQATANRKRAHTAMVE